MKKILTLILVLCLFLTCSACNNGNNDNVKPDEPTEVTADITMANFVKKLKAGNYLIDAKNYVRTSVVSPEQVYFTYNNDSGYDDYAFVTLKGETFEGILDENALTEITFVSTDNAIDALTYLLPNNWITISDGNMFNLFYNNVDNPLEFTTNDENVKTTLLGLGGYGQLALANMEEVHMLLDKADPTSVRFTAVIHDIPAARIYYDDLDLTINFGVAQGDPRIDKWSKNPVYPATRTSWTRNDINTFEQLFMRGYGKDTIPFPSFASYTLRVDDSEYMSASRLYITDAHGTEKDVEGYIQALLNRGYKRESVTLSDGNKTDVYRLLLREEYGAYIQRFPSYDKGFEMELSLYYDTPTYEGLAAISDVVVKNGYAELPETDKISEWFGTDTGKRRSEGWAYFFNYDLYMQMLLKYEDYDAALAYCQDYGNRLIEKGFVEEYTPDSNGAKFRSTNGSKTFRYTFNDDGTLAFEFRSEKDISVEEVKKRIVDNGIPECDLHGDISARDITRYHYEISEFEGLYLNVYQPFDSNEEAEKFLDDYVAILEEQGYYYTNPQVIGSYRTFGYLNEELFKFVGFDLLRGEDSATVFFEFVSVGGREESILGSAIHY